MISLCVDREMSWSIVICRSAEYHALVAARSEAHASCMTICVIFVNNVWQRSKRHSTKSGVLSQRHASSGAAQA